MTQNRKSFPRYLLVHQKPRNTGSCPRDKIVEMIAVVSNEEEKEEEEELEGELEEEGENEEAEGENEVGEEDKDEQ